MAWIPSRRTTPKLSLWVTVCPMDTVCTEHDECSWSQPCPSCGIETSDATKHARWRRRANDQRCTSTGFIQSVQSYCYSTRSSMNNTNTVFVCTVRHMNTVYTEHDESTRCEHYITERISLTLDRWFFVLSLLSHTCKMI